VEIVVFFVIIFELFCLLFFDVSFRLVLNLFVTFPVILTVFFETLFEIVFLAVFNGCFADFTKFLTVLELFRRFGFDIVVIVVSACNVAVAEDDFVGGRIG